MGLNIMQRDRLCVIQLSDGTGNAHLVQFHDGNYDDATNLKQLLADNDRQFIFHYARFDLAAIEVYLGVSITNIFCTKIASKLARTYTDKHGLKDVCKELIGKDLSKQQQSSNWGGEALSDQQITYAASDVLYLHKIREKLTALLEQENRFELFEQTCRFLPTRVALDIGGWEHMDIFSHSST